MEIIVTLRYPRFLPCRGVQVVVQCKGERLTEQALNETCNTLCMPFDLNLLLLMCVLLPVRLQKSLHHNQSFADINTCRLANYTAIGWLEFATLVKVEV